MERRVMQGPETKRRWQSGLALLILPTWLLLVSAPHFSSSRQANQAQEESSAPLEIRSIEPPQWQKDCLNISLDRINHTSSPLFLPDMGLYIYTSVKELRDDDGTQTRQGWINVYGASDIVSWEATAIAPGATIHYKDCLPAGVFVVNLKMKTRREIPVRGKLRIDAYYFLTEKDWQQDKSSHEEMLRTPPDQWDKIARHDPKVVTFYSAIPCRKPGCESFCNDPPLILHGENRILPDVFYLDHDLEVRGKKLSEELARKFPDCSTPNSEPR